MEAACADIECCLKVHSNCESCMMKTIDVLRAIRGVYSVNWDAEQNYFKISGEVDPSILLKAVMMRTGEHAEVVNVKINHPLLRYRNYSYGSTSRSHLPTYRDGYRSSLPNLHYYETNDRYYPYGMPHGPAQIGYTSSNYNTTYDYQNPLPRATYVPSYPYQEYHDPYYNYEGMNICTIM